MLLRIPVEIILPLDSVILPSKIIQQSTKVQILTKLFILTFIMVSIFSNESHARLFRNNKNTENQFISFENQNKSVVLPPGAELLKDLSYGADSAQKLDIYLPPKTMLLQNAPIILMVHGGAWMLGDKANYPVVQNKINRWLKKGIIFVSVNYRMSFSPNPLQQVDDIDSALNYIVTNGKKYGGDPNKIILMGHSAGAHLISLLTSNESYLKKNPHFKWLGSISLDSAAFDLVEIMKTEHHRFYDRVFGSDTNFWKSNSPLHQIDKKIVPMLIVCSKQRSDSCNQAEVFMKKAISLGSSITLLPVDLTHSEINLNIGLDGKYNDDIEHFLKQVGVTIID